MRNSNTSPDTTKNKQQDITYHKILQDTTNKEQQETTRHQK